MTNRIPVSLRDSISQNKIVFLAGAGLSRPLGLPSWNGFIQDLLEHMAADGNEGLIDLLEPLKKGVLSSLDVLDKCREVSEVTVRRQLSRTFSVRNLDRSSLSVHRLLWEISRKIVTTNWDLAFEQALEVDPVIPRDNLGLADLAKREQFLFKPHGTAVNAESCAVFPSDYEKIYSSTSPEFVALNTIFTRFTVVAIGFSGDDTYVRDFLAHLSRVFQGMTEKPWIILRPGSGRERIERVFRVLEVDDFDESLTGLLSHMKKCGVREPVARPKVSQIDIRWAKQNTGRFLRRRCRHIAEQNGPFATTIFQLFTLGGGEKSRAAVRKLEPEYERVVATALLYERRGKVDLMLGELDSVRLVGPREHTRLLLRAIALEKLDKVEEALESIVAVLGETRNDAMLRAAQYNRLVCLEKLGKLGQVDFQRFIPERHVQFGDSERLSDKALASEMIFCLKTGREFLFEDELDESLAYLKLHSWIGWLKSLLTRRELLGGDLDSLVIHDLVESKDTLDSNGAAALLVAGAKYLEPQDPLMDSLRDALLEIKDRAQDETVDKYWREFLNFLR